MSAELRSAVAAHFVPCVDATLLGLRIQRWRNGGARVGVEFEGEIVWSPILARAEAERVAGLLVALGEP